MRVTKAGSGFTCTCITCEQNFCYLNTENKSLQTSS